MNRGLVDRIANTVLYEGYILYPYRPSIKNRQRWTFGGLYPEAYCRTRDGGSDAANNQTECLIEGNETTTVEAIVRFLHLTSRQVGEVKKGVGSRFDGDVTAETTPDPFFDPVETLRVDDRLYHSWQEAEEREAAFGARTLGDLSAQAHGVPFSFRGGRREELVRDADGEVVGVLARLQQDIAGVMQMEAAEIAAGLYRLTLRVINRTPLPDAERARREDAQLRSLISAHTLLGVQGGEFISLLDPPEHWRDAAAACRNVGVWPVLVGAEEQYDTMLASPIILYDYPQLAPESPGDFFDATEIDEMLTLRILTLTDDEKLAMSAVDERARALLARTERLGQEQFLGLHGTIRALRPVAEEEGEHV